MGRRHAQIDVRTDGVFLVDLSSANGTELTAADGRTQQVSGQVQLQSGMRIALGGEDGVWIRSN
jgi:pSer/pThr/pTyr-binding forkhead associated (FHA) protein